MAISQIQKATGTSSTTTVTATLGSTPANGNTLIAVHFSRQQPTTPSGWTLARQRVFGTDRYLSIFRKNAGASEPTGLTVTATGSDLQDLHLYEYAGLDATPEDKGVDNAGTTNSLSTGTTAATTVADELLIAAAAGIAALNGVNSYTNSFTEQADTARMGSGDRIVSATGTYETTIGWTTSRSAAAILQTFKGASGTSVAGSQATETDTAQAGTPRVVPAGSLATETDAANAGSLAIRKPGSQATETDVANAGSLAVAIAGSQAVETDTANAGSSGGNTNVAGSLATETDTALAGTVAVAIPGGRADETDTAQSGTPALSGTGSLAVEVDTPNPGAALVVIPGSQATEVDEANAGTATGGIVRDLDWTFLEPTTRWTTDELVSAWTTGAPAL